MKLTNEDLIATLDADFAEMAVLAGRHAWGLPQLTMREKAFVFIAADMCARGLGFPLRTHVTMASAQGVGMNAMREAVRHLAPYVGYPTAAEALMVLAEIEAPRGAEVDRSPAKRAAPQDELIERIAQLDNDFAAFFTEQFAQRWARPEMSRRERALATIAVDVLNGTLEESLPVHVKLAMDDGAGEEQVRAVVLLVAEFGIAKAWRAFRALSDVFATIGTGHEVS